MTQGQRESEIIFDTKIDDEMKSKMSVSLVFKPDANKPNLITVTKAVKDFRFGEWGDLPIAVFTPEDVFNGRGTADLKKLTITYTGTGRVVIRNIRIECENGQKWGNPDIKLTTLDCSALTPQEAK